MLIFTQFQTTVHLAWDVLILKVKIPNGGEHCGLSRDVRQVDFCVWFRNIVIFPNTTIIPYQDFCRARFYFIWIIRIRLKWKRYPIQSKSKKSKYPAGLDSKIRILYTTDCHPDNCHQRWASTGSSLDILQDTCDFFGSGLDLDIDFWNKLYPDRIRIFVWFL